MVGSCQRATAEDERDLLSVALSLMMSLRSNFFVKLWVSSAMIGAL